MGGRQEGNSIGLDYTWIISKILIKGNIDSKQFQDE